MITLSRLAMFALVASPLAAQLPPLPRVDTTDFYVSDYQNDRVAVYDGSGTFLRHFTTPGLTGPRGIVFGSNGQIYVASQTSSEVYVFDANENLLSSFSHMELSGPTGMAESAGGELFVTSFSNSKVCVFALDGTFQRSFTGGGLGFPNCATFDSQGNIYVASVTGAMVVKFDANEQFVTTFRPPAPIPLSSPMGIARDECDNIYVAGGGSNNIVKFASDGTYLAEITSGQLTGPQGVAIDDRGHIFSSSFYQDRIVEFDPNGVRVQSINSGNLRIPRSIAFKPGPGTAITAMGCGVNPAGSLVVQSGEPVLGSTVSIDIDNPIGTQVPGTTTPYLLGSLRAFATPPCGASIPGFGMGGNGASGELLIDLTPTFFVLQVTGPSWQGSGQPSNVTFDLPMNCDFAGKTLYVQGVMLDFGLGSAAPIALTDGASIRIRG